MSGKSRSQPRAFTRVLSLWRRGVTRLVSLPWRADYSVALIVQLLLFPFGHWFDTRVFFGTGAGVAHGMSPYSYYDLGTYYDWPSLTGGVPGIGYAPPWALFLAAAYDMAYLPTRNPFFMNLAIKAPIIVSNLLLARFVRIALQTRGCSSTWSKRAELLVLFNPFLLYTSTLWNMYDTLVVLLFLMSLDFLEKGRPAASGFALGASIALKHLALPLVPLAWLWLATRTSPRRKRIRSLLVFDSALAGILGLLVLAPFLVFGWPVSGFEAAAGYQAQVTGGFTIYRFIPVDLTSSTALALLGYLPAIAVAVAYVFLYKTPLKDFGDLTQLALVVSIVFMTTRTWVSEQNLALIFPLALLPELLKGRGFRFPTSAWIVFFAYAVGNAIPVQFAFLLVPTAQDMTSGIANSPVIGPIREAILFGCFIAWIAVAWNYVVRRA